MRNLVLAIENDGLATILMSDEEGEPQRFATIYRMKDGWHTKLASQHTRHAWAGPFDTAEEAFQALKASVSEPA